MGGRSGESDLLAHPTGYQVDIALLERFEEGLDPADPERNQIPCRVLGYGEISTVFSLDIPPFQLLALKRMAMFRTLAELRPFLAAYREYCRLLSEEAGLNLPAHGYAVVHSRDGRPILYLFQEKLPPGTIGHAALHTLPDDQAVALVEQVLAALERVWAFNARQETVRLALDSQISNWGVPDMDPLHPAITPDLKLHYLDTSTPLFRVSGIEQMDTTLFLRAAPPGLDWVMERMFLEDVVGRYYDLRRVLIDLLANLYKEQRAGLIPDLLPICNAFLERQEAVASRAPLKLEEIQGYYREDAFIWRLYLGSRRLDRFLRGRILRRPYPYILPGPVQR